MPVRAAHWADAVADFVERQMTSPARAAGPDSAKAAAGIAARASGKSEQRAGKLCNLAGAQFVIARSHGFRNWSGLIHHIRSLASSGSPEGDFETAADAIVAGDLATLRRLLRRNPELGRGRPGRAPNA